MYAMPELLAREHQNYLLAEAEQHRRARVLRGCGEPSAGPTPTQGGSLRAQVARGQRRGPARRARRPSRSTPEPMSGARRDGPRGSTSEPDVGLSHVRGAGSGRGRTAGVCAVRRRLGRLTTTRRRHWAWTGERATPGRCGPLCRGTARRARVSTCAASRPSSTSGTGERGPAPVATLRVEAGHPGDQLAAYRHRRVQLGQHPDRTEPHPMDEQVLRRQSHFSPNEKSGRRMSLTRPNCSRIQGRLKVNRSGSAGATNGDRKLSSSSASRSTSGRTNPSSRRPSRLPPRPGASRSRAGARSPVRTRRGSS